MTRVLVMIGICLFFVGCSNTKDDDIKKLMEDNEYIIIDVRTKEEYDYSHLKDAINIPYDEIDENIQLDRDKIIFVYCQSGNRSKIAYDNLTDLEYTVYDLGAYSEIDLPKNS